MTHSSINEKSDLWTRYSTIGIPGEHNIPATEFIPKPNRQRKRRPTMIYLINRIQYPRFAQTKIDQLQYDRPSPVNAYPIESLVNGEAPRTRHGKISTTNINWRIYPQIAAFMRIIISFQRGLDREIERSLARASCAYEGTYPSGYSRQLLCAMIDWVTGHWRAWHPRLDSSLNQDIDGKVQVDRDILRREYELDWIGSRKSHTTPGEKGME